MMVTLSLRSAYQSAAVFSSVEPAATQMVAPSRSFGSLAPDFARTTKVWPSYKLMPWKLTPSEALRENVMVVLRDSRSTWPDWSTGHRCCTEVGVYLTLPASPSTAAATARQ